MTLTLERYFANHYVTIGRIVCDGKEILSTAEPPLAINADHYDSYYAVGTGVYTLAVHINPKSGTPTIKVMENNCPANLSIRCQRSFSTANVSPYAVRLDEKTGLPVSDYAYADWARLLSLVADAQERGEMVLLEIVQKL